MKRARLNRQRDEKNRRAKGSHLVARVFAAIYLGFLLYNLSVGSKGWMDNCFTLLLLGALVLLTRLAAFGWPEMLLANCALLIHNLGTVGEAYLYQYGFGLGPYDVYVHIIGAAVAGWLLFRFFRGRNGANAKNVFLLAVSATILLGIAIELLEFTGFLFMDKSSGFFNPADSIADAGQANVHYIDTMMDILANIAGAAAGAAICAAAGGLRSRPHSSS